MAKWDLSKLEKPQFGAAQARRFYMHVQEGGTLTARDVARMVEALEEVFQMYVDANEARIDAEAKLAEVDALWEVMERSLEESDAREAMYSSRLEARITELEAKMAKAVRALDEAVYLLAPNEKDMMRQAGVYRIVTTLAELTGGKDE